MILFQNGKKYIESKYTVESEFEQEIVNANKKLIEIYEQKIKEKTPKSGENDNRHNSQKRNIQCFSLKDAS